MEPKLTAAELDELERLHGAATKGEWRFPTQPESMVNIWSEWDDRTPNVAHEVSGSDARAIASIHNAFPRLIALARRGLEARHGFPAWIPPSPPLSRVVSSVPQKRCMPSYRSAGQQLLAAHAAEVERLTRERDEALGRSSDLESALTAQLDPSRASAQEWKLRAEVDAARARIDELERRLHESALTIDNGFAAAERDARAALARAEGERDARERAINAAIDAARRWGGRDIADKVIDAVETELAAPPSPATTRETTGEEPEK